MGAGGVQLAPWEEASQQQPAPQQSQSVAPWEEAARAQTKPAQPAPAEPQGWRDQLTKTIPLATEHTGIPAVDYPLNAAANFGAGVLTPILHPIKTAESMGQAIEAGGMSPGGMYPTTAPTLNPERDRLNQQIQTQAQEQQRQQAQWAKAHPGEAIPAALGSAVTGALAGEALGGFEGFRAARMGELSGTPDAPPPASDAGGGGGMPPPTRPTPPAPPSTPEVTPTAAAPPVSAEEAAQLRATITAEHQAGQAAYEAGDLDAAGKHVAAEIQARKQLGLSPNDNLNPAKPKANPIRPGMRTMSGRNDNALSQEFSRAVDRGMSPDDAASRLRMSADERAAAEQYRAARAPQQTAPDQAGPGTKTAVMERPPASEAPPWLEAAAQQAPAETAPPAPRGTLPPEMASAAAALTGKTMPEVAAAGNAQAPPAQTAPGLPPPAGPPPPVPPHAAPAPLQPSTAQATNQPQPVGAQEPATGRPILQATDNPATLQSAAQAQAPWLEQQANATVQGIDGAKVDAVREKKQAADLGEKLNKEGQPAETIPDYLGGRIIVDSPAAHEQVAERIRQTMPVVRETDDFEKGSDPYGFHAHTFQVRTPDGNSAELQVVPKEQAEVNDQTHGQYEKGEKARIAGDQKQHEQIARKVRATHDAAMQAFNQRNQQQAPPQIKPGDAVTYPTNGGKMRPGKVVRIDGDNAYVRDGFTTIKKPLAKLQPVGGSPVKPGNEQPSNQVAQQEVPPSSTGVKPQNGTSGQGDESAVKDGKWTGVDLDGTLAQYDGFKGPTVIGEPIAPMVDRVKGWLKEGKTVKILTARVSDDPTGETKRAIQDWTEKHIGQRLDVTDVKDAHMTALYDDRAVPVERNTGKLLAEPQPEGNQAQPERTYEAVQRDIDKAEDDLEASGEDVTKLYFPEHADGPGGLTNAPGWKPMPDNLVKLYAERDAIGSGQLKQSIDEIENALKKAGVSDESEMRRVLQYYALDKSRTDAAKQYMASEYTKETVDRDPKKQVADIYSALAPLRDIPMDDHDDLWRNRKLTRDAIAIVKAVVGYFNGGEAPHIAGLLPEGKTNAESRNGSESPAATTPSGEGSEKDAVREPKAKVLLQREPGQDRPEGSGRIQPGEQGQGTAGAGAGSEAKPLGRPGGGEKPEEVSGPLRKGDRVIAEGYPDRPGTITYEEDGMGRVRFDDNPREVILSLKKLRRVQSKAAPSFYKPKTPQVAPMAGTSPLGAKPTVNVGDLVHYESADGYSAGIGTLEAINEDRATVDTMNGRSVVVKRDSLKPYTPPAKRETEAPKPTKAAIIPTRGGVRVVPIEDEPAAPVEKPSQEAQKTGVDALIDAIYEKIKSGQSLGNVIELNKMAEQYLGSSRTSGEWTPKDLFDAMEAAVNKHLLDVGKRLLKEPAEQALGELRELMGRLTSQGVRTDDQVKNQQFSTPPTEAYVVARVAALTPSDVVLEPSAGNGGIAVWPLALGAEAHVNEIAERRQKMLEAVGFDKPTAHDGELINALLDQAIKPTVILMNPPFSASTLKSYEAKNQSRYGFNHVEQALQRLAPGGRLVAILGGGREGFRGGEGASLRVGESGKWFDKIAKEYNVRANIRVDGKEYAKYGISYATRIIVIDKDGPTPSKVGPERDWSSVVEKDVDTLEEAYNVLRPVEESRPLNAGNGPENARSPGGGPAKAGLVPDTDTSVSGVRSGTGRSDGADGEVSAPVRPDRTRSGAPTPRPAGGSEQLPVHRPGSETERRDEGKAAAGTGASAAHGDDQRQVAERGLDLEREEAKVQRDEEEESSSYTAYQPTLKGAKHPGTIVETKSMATVPMPPITYKPNLPEAVVGKGPDFANAKLSAVQLEAVAIAGMQNDIILPGGFRGSALIGDGTGVGKGREGAAILWDNWRKGRRRLVWMTKSKDLIVDAIRDLEGLGAHDLAKSIKNLGKMDASAPIEHEGILFTTYALFRSGDKKGNTRANQIDKWLRGQDGGEGGYLLMDESHSLKNAVVSQGAQASQIGQTVKKFLEKMPPLRTVSLSATAATDVMNLGYLDRLGLWGPGTPFPNGFNQFAGEIAHGGMSAMEMIARELKAQGKYVSRTLTYRGVEYREIKHEITLDQKAIYAAAAQAWRDVFESAEHTIMHTTGGGSRQKAMAMSQFFSAQQRFFNLLLTSIKIPTAVKEAEAALARGESVAITLVNTNEAAQNREKDRVAADDSGEEPDYDFGPGKLITDLVEEHYPTQQYKDDVDSNGNPIKVPVVDAKGNPVQNPQAVAAKNELLRKLTQLRMPANPLDELIEQLGGPSKVAELTGRKQRYDSASNRLVNRGGNGVSQDKVNKAEEGAFQSGRKRVAILSSAADTGISLHSDKGAKNQQKRFVITLQVGWSADKQMQMNGRFNRSNQANAPEFGLLKTDLGGESRFISSIARRMESLEALSKGQTKTNTGTEAMSKVNFETDQGRAAAVAFYNSLLANRDVPGALDAKGEQLSGRDILRQLRVLKGSSGGGETVPPADRSNITRLLNRLLALDPDIQQPVYNYFYDIFDATVRRAEADGTLDTGVKRLPGDSFDIKEQRVLSSDPATGANTFYYPIESKVRVHRMDAKTMEERFDKLKKSSDHPIIMRGPNGELAMMADASPIVHADGKIQEAVHVMMPNALYASKEPASKYHNWKAIDAEARDKIEKAEKAIERADHDVAYYTKTIERGEANGYVRDYEKEELAKAIKEKEDAQKELKEAKSALRKMDPVEMAQEEWQKQFESAPAHRTATYHLIGGAVMRFWNPIREASGRRLDVFSAVDSKSGDRVVGIEIPGNQINSLLARITGGKSVVDAHQIIDDVFKNATQYELEGGIKVRRGRVAGTSVIQFVTSNSDVQAALKSMGVLYERGVQPVYYLPTGDYGGWSQQGEDILEKVLEQYPAKVDTGEDKAAPAQATSSPLSGRESVLPEAPDDAPAASTPITADRFENGMQVKVIEVPPGSYLSKGDVYKIALNKGHVISFENVKTGGGTSETFASANRGMYARVSAPDEKPGTDLGNTFYSGFGDPELFKRLFPALADSIAQWASNEPTTESTQKEIMRQKAGEMDRRIAIAVHMLRRESKGWRTRSHDDSIKFWNAVEDGRLDLLDPKDRHLAEVFKQAFDSMRAQLQRLKPEILRNYIENYFPHIWERPSMARAAIRGYLTGKRPLQGKASFLKQRTIPTMQDGLDMGFTPQSWNPVDSFLLKYAEMAQFLMGHQVLDVMKKASTAKFVRISDKRPDGWKQLDDRIGTVYRRVTAIDEDKLDDVTQPLTWPGGTREIPGAFSEDIEDATHGEMALVGHYYAPADAAQVFNNYVSKGIAGRFPIFDVVRWMNSNLNALQLGVSAFHASMITGVGAVSDIALGVQQLTEGKPVDFAAKVGRGILFPISALNTVRNGYRLMKEYLQPGSYAAMAKEAAAVTAAGGRLKENTLQIKPLDKAINSFANGAILKGLFAVPGAILQTFTGPIMDHYVPLMKFGIFYGLAHDILDEQGRGKINAQVAQTRLNEAWNSVDNRAGQMVYRNLFWHRAILDLLQVATRSVGWNYGTINEAGTALSDTGKAVVDVAHGKKPRLSPAMAFAIALPLTMGMWGAAANYMRTGHAPETWKDYFYLRNSDGTYLAPPTYMKDVFNYGHDPAGTFANKLGPLWEATSEAVRNKDFYGTEIRHKDDPMVEQMGEVARWAAKQTIPFAFSSAGKTLERRGAQDTLASMIQEGLKHPGDVLAGQLGFTPAPAFIQNSEALNKAREYQAENAPPGTRTKEQAERTRAMRVIENMYRTRTVDADAIRAMVKSGVLSEQDRFHAQLESRTDPLVRAVKALHPEQALNVYRSGTPGEQKELRPVIEAKQREIKTDVPRDQQEALRAAFRSALHPQPRFTGPSA